METTVLKCGYCGAAIDLDEVSLESRICKCKYCKKTVLIPKDRGQVKNWYNRAEELRAACEFDRAIDVYEKILTEDNTDPQAHWGMALSKCGIEFVLDGKTGEYLPTCHRTTEQTILGEPEYQAALEHAEASQRAVIEAEAQKIHEIQKKILSISKQEQPYDVFISYKEEDEQKNRTKDSVLAQQIYDELKKKNYRVFYARKTLEGKLGSEYEPIIYAALSSAKVMVVVGTKPEHFKATWVRNEWRRFQLMGKDGGKTIIPAYRDMYPDELPPELSALTALDMEKIGFLQELVDSVDRILGAKASGTEEGTEAIGRERLAKNGNTFLDLGKTDKARASFEQMTETYPEDYRGWWGLLECETDRFRRSAADQMEQLADWYTTAVKTAPTEKRAELQDRFYRYLRELVSPDLANLEVDRKRSAMRQNQAMQQKLKQEIGEQKASVKRVPSLLQENLEAAEKGDAKLKAEIQKEEKASRVGDGFIATVIFAVLGYVCFKADGWWILLGIVSAFLFFCCLVASIVTWAGRNDHIEKIDKLNQEMSKIWDDKSKNDDKLKKQEEKANNAIAQAKTELEQFRREYQAMEAYCARPIRERAEEQYQQCTAELDQMIK